MELDIDSHAITITCPACSKKFEEKIGRLKKNPKLTCKGCGAVIAIEAKELRSATDAIKKSLDKLRATLGKLK